MKENNDDEGLLITSACTTMSTSLAPISNSVYFRRPIGETSLITASPLVVASLHFLVSVEIDMLSIRSMFNALLHYLDIALILVPSHAA
jgi:hypothetical protein